MLFIRYNSRYFYNKSCCFHSFSPYTTVFHYTEFYIAEHCISFLQEIACFCCRSVLSLPVRNAPELAPLTHRALEYVKIIMQSCWLALAHSLSFLCITFSIHTGSSVHLYRKEDLGIRMIPVLCTRTESSHVLNHLNQWEQSCLLCLDAARAEKCRTPGITWIWIKHFFFYGIHVLFGGKENSKFLGSQWLVRWDGTDWFGSLLSPPGLLLILLAPSSGLFQV